MGYPERDPQERPRTDTDEGTPETTVPRLLFAVDGGRPTQVLPLVCDLVADADAELLIGSPVVLPEQTPGGGRVPRREGERLAAKIVLRAKQQCDSHPPIEHVVATGKDRDAIMTTMIDRYDVSTVITEDQPRSGLRSLIGLGAVDEAAVSDACDTIVVARIQQLHAIESILVPVARGPHSGLALETGLALARQNRATLELLHVSTTGDEDGRARGREVLETGSDRLEGYDLAEHTLLEADEGPATIIEYSQPFDITVFGAPRARMLRHFLSGTLPEAASEAGDGAVLVAHRAGAEDSWLDTQS